MIDVSIHPRIDNNFVAAVSGADDTHWLTIRSVGKSVTVFGKAEHVEAFKMMADIFNDAFAAAPEPAPPATPPDDDDGIPF